MDTITLTHQGWPVALAAATRVGFAAHIEALRDGHPRKRLVCFMALFARDVLTGPLPGPYTNARAEHFARLALIAPTSSPRTHTQPTPSSPTWSLSPSTRSPRTATNTSRRAKQP